MFEIHISFDIQSVLFGKYKNRNLFRFNNLVILTVKQYIFSCKYKSHPFLSIHVVRNIIVERLLSEKYLLLKNCKHSEYENYWQYFCEKL